MRDVTYSMTTSLDGYVVGPDGGMDWGQPDEEVFRLATDEVRGLGVHLMGRRLYESMLFWETAEQHLGAGSVAPGGVGTDLLLEFATLWRSLPKVVFSRTLRSVQGRARLAVDDPATELRRCRAEPGAGGIAVGGATLAAELGSLGLIDEYRLRICPVLVGGGIPYFPTGRQRSDLELVENRVVGTGVVYQRYRTTAAAHPTDR